ncbi:transposase [Candidatus Halobeggiatoa sp. HSG11]|nr:transposase [Candidatus Halobeggiatoa sp. HSG11]
MFKQHINTPTHLFLDNTTYFITSATYLKRHLLVQSEIKESLLSLISESFGKFGWKLNDWVILDNHYHLLAVSDKGRDLTKIIKKIHGVSAHFIRQKTGCELPVWWNYWDYCPRDDADYYTKLNYLFMNPVKHGYVSDLNDYRFSSFSSKLEKIGRDAMVEQFHNYRCRLDVDEIYDEF